MYKILFAFFLIILTAHLSAQDLLNILKDTTPTHQYTTATFKTTRIVLGKSIENVPKGNLLFTISHHFSQINQGIYNLYGLDLATIRFGLEYGITDWLDVGIGRAEYEKTYDGFIKFKLFRQQTGYRNIPVTVSFVSDMDIFTLKWVNPTITHYTSDRMTFVQQLLIARKFSKSFSFQIMPTLVHKNMVQHVNDKNDILAVGAGGRIKITKRISFNAEWYCLLPGNPATTGFNNPLSVGFDIETGGHVFQIFLTNSQGEFERTFITETQGTWQNKFIYLGFNINRIFTIIKPKGWQKEK